jgi:eukaryotic-like serine/threonine-protein kinase
MMSSPSPTQAATAVSPHALTVAAVVGPSIDSDLHLTSPPASTLRTTVLPRAEGGEGAVHLVREERARYDPIRPIATGGMGEVVLMYDQDIARPVAVKRLLPELDDTAALLRFVDEIRIIGQLEHPNIVPIHDVGVDEQGRYFFVMKYVEGETLASILDRLREGDADYHRKFTVERRIEIFLGILYALEFAHSRGILHRDIKPSNVMVGRFGEVVVMDWGIAKPMAAARAALAASTRATSTDGDAEAPSGLRSRPLGEPVTSERRVLPTRVGAYVGTPLYMSPEQALGKNDELDGRSDLYSAAVLFHEMLTLRHYLGERATVQETLTAVAGEEVSHRALFAHPHAHQAPTPIELRYVAAKGLQKDPASRFQTAGAMIEAVQHVLEGRGMVFCEVTFAKRFLRDIGRFVDRHPRIFMLAMLVVMASVVFTSVALVRTALS